MVLPCPRRQPTTYTTHQRQVRQTQKHRIACYLHSVASRFGAGSVRPAAQPKSDFALPARPLACCCPHPTNQIPAHLTTTRPPATNHNSASLRSSLVCAATPDRARPAPAGTVEGRPRTDRGLTSEAQRPCAYQRQAGSAFAWYWGRIDSGGGIQGLGFVAHCWRDARMGRFWCLGLT